MTGIQLVRWSRSDDYDSGDDNTDMIDELMGPGGRATSGSGLEVRPIAAPDEDYVPGATQDGRMGLGPDDMIRTEARWPWVGKAVDKQTREDLSSAAVKVAGRAAGQSRRVHGKGSHGRHRIACRRHSPCGQGRGQASGPLGNLTSPCLGQTAPGIDGSSGRQPSVSPGDREPAAGAKGLEQEPDRDTAIRDGKAIAGGSGEGPGVDAAGSTRLPGQGAQERHAGGGHGRRRELLRH